VVALAGLVTEEAVALASRNCVGEAGSRVVGFGNRSQAFRAASRARVFGFAFVISAAGSSPPVAGSIAPKTQ
jgi:hypothetical protein